MHGNAILSRPEPAATLEQVAPLPGDMAGPVFAEPWQAQAFAMVVALHQRGLFTWAEWADRLSQEIAGHGHAMAGSPDDGSHYYALWLEALEHVLIEKGLSSHAGIDALADAWSRAAEATPHGRPIELANDPLR